MLSVVEAAAQIAHLFLVKSYITPKHTEKRKYFMYRNFSKEISR